MATFGQKLATFQKYFLVTLIINQGLKAALQGFGLLSVMESLKMYIVDKANLEASSLSLEDVAEKLGKPKALVSRERFLPFSVLNF